MRQHLRWCFLIALFMQAAVPAIVAQTTMVNDTDPTIIYSMYNANGNFNTSVSNWSYSSGVSGEHNSDQHASNFVRSGTGPFQGASFFYPFSGTAIQWFGTKCPICGYANVYIDGVLQMQVNATAPAFELSTLMFNIQNLPAGPHVLSVQLNATIPTGSSDAYQVVDYLNVTGTSLNLSGAQTYGYNSSSWGFSPGGAWVCGGYLSSDLSGGHCYSRTAGSTMSMNFTTTSGGLLGVVGRPDAENGWFSVSIDGVNVGNVDGNFGTIDDDTLSAVLMFAKQVSAGQHTLTITVLAEQDHQALGDTTQIDEVFIFPNSGSNGSCQYQQPPEGQGQAPVGLSVATQSGASPPALYWDAGSQTHLQLYQNYGANKYQDFTWTSVSPGFTVCTQGGAGYCLSASNGELLLSPAADVFQILPNSTALDVTSCQFVQIPPGATNATTVTLGTTQSVWNFQNTH
jgi:hypothetical protein